MKSVLFAAAAALASGGGQISLELWSCGRRSRLPDFNSLGSAHRSKMVETVNYPNRGWGFDETVGGRHFCHEFCARFRGRVTAPKSGTYQFSLSSDDGSKLFVDNALIINNDSWAFLWTRPLTFAILVTAALILFVPMLSPFVKRSLARRREAAGEGG